MNLSSFLIIIIIYGGVATKSLLGLQSYYVFKLCCKNIIRLSKDVVSCAIK